MIHNATKVQHFLEQQNIDAVLISSVPNIIYLTGFAHFSTEEREAYILVAKHKQFIFTDARYSEAVKKQVKNFTLVETRHDAPFIHNLENILNETNSKKLGIEVNNLTVAEYQRLKKLSVTFTPFSLYDIRWVKHAKEIDAISSACALGDKAFAHVLSKIHEGISEKKLAFELEMFIRQNNADISFRPIVAFGANSAIPHHGTSEKKLEKNSIVLLDFGVKYNNYCSDMTRTVFFGSAPDKFKKIYQTVLDAQQKATDTLNSKFPATAGSRTRVDIIHNSENKSAIASEIDLAARKHILSQGYPSIPHSLGHGIGLEVHEAPSLSPNSKDQLQEGMVFSVEPGIYSSGYGGVRIEDLVVITKNGIEQLTRSPKSLIEI